MSRQQRARTWKCGAAPGPAPPLETPPYTASPSAPDRVRSCSRCDISLPKCWMAPPLLGPALPRDRRPPPEEAAPAPAGTAEAAAAEEGGTGVPATAHGAMTLSQRWMVGCREALLASGHWAKVRLHAIRACVRA